MASPPAMLPSAPQTPYGLGPLVTAGAARLPVLIPSLMKRTDASAIPHMTPPGCLLAGGRTLPLESALALSSLTQLGPLGPMTVPNATRSAWPSHHSRPNLDLTLPAMNLPP